MTKVVKLIQINKVYDRVFVALKLPNNVLRQIHLINNYLDNKIIRKVKLNNLHMTLYFLGHVNSCQIELLKLQLIDNLKQCLPFVLSLSTVGVFTQTKNTKILWLGVKGNTGKLAYMQSEISKVVDGLNLGVKRVKFKPHITLGRIKNGDNVKQNEVFSQNIKLIEKAILETPPFEVKSVVIIYSVPSKNGHQYNEIQTICLKP